ncbi:MAG: Xaa-Pro aminopeptidase, partial [Flavobacteriales bacterium]|nr:Xaa-Pro aminopeptidase [Flavobacteriales bacterium]
MKYQPISKKLFENNRANFNKQVVTKSLSVFCSNDQMPTNADGTMPFKQNSDLFWLSGVDQEESKLILFPDCSNPNHREVLFLKETNDLIAIWEGEKLSKDKAFETSGVKTVYWNSQFESIFKELMEEATSVYLNSNEHARATSEVQTQTDRFNQWCKAEFSDKEYLKSAPIMHDLRAVKHQIEIDLLQHACNITEKGFRRVLNFVKPGVMEYEIEA